LQMDLLNDAFGNQKKRLLFFFFAPTYKAAESLSAQLKDRAGYEVQIKDIGEELLVVATSTPFGMSQKAVDKRIKKMCNHAREHGCVFDGWETEWHKSARSLVPAGGTPLASTTVSSSGDCRPAM